MSTATKCIGGDHRWGSYNSAGKNIRYKPQMPSNAFLSLGLVEIGDLLRIHYKSWTDKEM